MKKDIVNKAIKKTLESSHLELCKLLKEIYPDYVSIIDYHNSGTKEVPFGEWFAFLFNLTEWTLEGPLEIHPDKVWMSSKAKKNLQVEYKKSKEDGTPFFRNFIEGKYSVECEKFPPLTVCRPDSPEEFRIVDGFHRYYHCKLENKVFTAYEWVKKENIHPNAGKIKSLIIKNLR